MSECHKICDHPNVDSSKLPSSKWSLMEVNEGITG
jgi:hypothetical protein